MSSIHGNESQSRESGIISMLEPNKKPECVETRHYSEYKESNIQAKEGDQVGQQTQGDNPVPTPTNNHQQEQTEGDSPVPTPSNNHQEEQTEGDIQIPTSTDNQQKQTEGDSHLHISKDKYQGEKTEGNIQPPSNKDNQVCEDGESDIKLLTKNNNHQFEEGAIKLPTETNHQREERGGEIKHQTKENNHLSEDGEGAIKHPAVKNYPRENRERLSEIQLHTKEYNHLSEEGDINPQKKKNHLTERGEGDNQSLFEKNNFDSQASEDHKSDNLQASKKSNLHEVDEANNENKNYMNDTTVETNEDSTCEEKSKEEKSYMLLQVSAYLRDHKYFFMAQSVTIVVSMLLGALLVKLPNWTDLELQPINDPQTPVDLIPVYKNISDLNKTCSSKLSELERVKENLTNTEKLLKDLIKHTQELNINQHTMKGEQEYAESKTTPLDTFFIAVFLLAIGELFIFLFVMNKVRSGVHTVTLKNHEAKGHQQPQLLLSNANYKPQELNIQDHIGRRPLEMSVCVLSFYGGRPHKNHMAISRTFVNQSTKCEEIIVNRHEDILKIPPSKVMLVHIDFNARNIILEDPSREIGDLKRQTVLAVQKMGAEVFLIYYEERNAKPIKDGHLYNSQLGSVTVHTVLRQLEANKRVISVPEGSQLTTHQRQHLQACMSRILT